MKITHRGHRYLAMGGGDIVFQQRSCLVWDDCGRKVRENEHPPTETNGKVKEKNPLWKQSEAVAKPTVLRLRAAFKDQRAVLGITHRGHTTQALGDETSSAQPSGFAGNVPYLLLHF